MFFKDLSFKDSNQAIMFFDAIYYLTSLVFNVNQVYFQWNLKKKNNKVCINFLESWTLKKDRKVKNANNENKKKNVKWKAFFHVNQYDQFDLDI